nr:ABC transporter substrate-binding protein [uncultured Gellertiella sp.]
MLRIIALVSALLFSLPLAAQAEGVLHLGTDVGFGAKTTMDPYDGNRFWPVINIVFDGLVTLTPDGKPEPRLATSWSSSENLTVWTFKLRTGVRFHDGRAFGAKDVLWSYKRMLDKDFDSPVRAVLSIIRDIKAVDDQTVEFDLSAPEADFPLLAGDYRALILPEGTTAESVHDKPIGTGPFIAETVDPEGTTVLSANPDYYGGKPKLSSIEVVAIADSSARVQALLSGQLDMLLTIDAKQAPLFAGNPDFTLQHIPSGDWNAIDFQTNVKPFDDVRVRKALRLAVDREALTRLVLGDGNGIVSCDTPVWNGDAYHSDFADCHQDIAGARKLLAEAGYPDGIDVEIFTSDVEENMVQIVEAYQAQVKAAGIRVKLSMTASDGFWDSVWMKRPAFVDSWGQRPATQVLNEVYRSTANWNPSVWKHPEFDAMLDKARAEPDFARRKALYGEIQKKLYDEGGMLIPYHKVLLRVLRDSVRGVEAPFVTENIDWATVDVE